MTGGRQAWHFITSEYPPQPGGVSDYTYSLAQALGKDGVEVHVWCPAATPATRDCPGVTVHRDLGKAGPKDLRRLDRELNRFPGPLQILVQWVPHGYGYRSMNLPFCLWLWKRSRRRGDSVDLMVHEPGLAFGEGSWRQNIPALVHRVMNIVLLRFARQVWVSIPEWERHLRPYTFGKDVPFQWLPIPSNIRVAADPSGVRAVRERYAPGGGLVAGHFGTYNAGVTPLLEPILSGLQSTPSPGHILLMGIGSEAYRDQLIRKRPELAPRVQAAGALTPEDLSRHIAACDLLIQPYIDGVSSRRTSVMVGLCHGKPILTNAGRLTENLWAGSGAVALAPNGSAGAFLDLLRSLCANDDQRARLGDAARRLYQERFDIAHVIEKLRQGQARETTCAF